MDLTHTQHIRIVVKSLESSILYWEKVFALHCSAIEVVIGSKIRTAFFKVKQARIDLIEIDDSEGLIGQFIEKNDKGVQHRVFALKNGIYSSPETPNIQLIDEQSCIDAIRMYNDFIHPELTCDTLIGLCEN